MVRVVLLGGIYGSGKTTTAKLIADNQSNPYSTAIVDYDTLIGNHAGKAVNVKKVLKLRCKVWNELFIPSIAKEIKKGKELVIVPGTFSTRKRRDKFIHALEKMADITALYFMLPHDETIARIQKSRTDETHLVNAKRYGKFYETFNEQFAQENHADFLLPHNRNLLPLEYQKLLSQQSHNKEILTTPHLDNIRMHRWIVSPKPLHIELFIQILKSGAKKPHNIRETLGYGKLQIAEMQSKMRKETIAKVMIKQ